MIDQLLKIQEEDLAIRGLEREIRDIPRRKQEEDARLKEHREALAAADAGLKQTIAETKKLELEVSTLGERILKLRQQQAEMKNNKDFRAVEDEIGNVRKQIAGLEDQELVRMESVEQAQAVVAEKKKALAAEQAMVDRDHAALDIRLKELQAQLEVHKQQRAGLAAAVSADWLQPYDRVFTRHEPALVRVQDGTCGGCHMALPPYIAHDARKRQAPVHCGFCGRMLY